MTASIWSPVDTTPIIARGTICVTDAPYNAVGDGLTNDTAAIQAALDDSDDSFVYFPKGLVFSITDTLTIKSDTTLTGGGAIFLAAGSDVHMLENENYASGANSNIVFEDIILDGNQINQSAYAGSYDTHIVHMKNVTGLKIRKCEIKNAGVDCVNLIDCPAPEILFNHLWGARNHAVTFQNSSGLRGIGNQIHDCGSKTDAYGITASGHAFIGVNVACDNVLLALNWVYDMGDSCLRNERAGEGWIIAFNLVVNSGKDSIKIMGYAGLAASPVANLVYGNVVINAGNDGIFVTGRCIVTGNYVFGTGKNVAGTAAGKWFASASGIKAFYNSTVQDYKVKITNNFCVDGLYAGIYVSGVDNAEIADNTCFLNGVAGIAVIECALGTILTQNVCTDNGTATVGSGFGIRCSLFSTVLQEGAVLKNNRCGNTDSVNQGYGIFLSGTETNDFIVKYNDLNNNVVQNFLNSSGAGTGNIVRYNEGHVTENMGIATIPNGATLIAVNHGLSITPTISQISVTPTNLLGAANKFGIGTISSSQFQIVVDVNPGAATATFSWQVH
jgi:parallel beta-helix repeat protein